MNDKKLKMLEEKAKAKGKTLLIESFQYRAESEDVQVFEGTKLIESVDGGQFQARGIIRNIPVSRYEKNRNNRVYSKQLFMNVSKNGMFNRGNCLADHADDSGSVKNICGVWHNFQVKDDKPYADLYCIGEYGQLLLDFVKAGGLAGFSISGFGDIMEDGYTVDPETYETNYEESVCDWVFTPSAAVYATVESNIDSNSDLEAKKESIPASGQVRVSLDEKSDNESLSAINNSSDVNVLTNTIKGKEGSLKESDNKKGKTMPEENIQKLLETNVKHQVERTIKEALKSTDRKEALESLASAEDLVSQHETLADTLRKVKEAQIKIQDALDTELKEKSAALEFASLSAEDLKDKLEMAESRLASIEKKYRIASKMVESMGKRKEKISGIFYRKSGGKADLFHNSGEVVTRLDADVYPVGSDKGARYEHPNGITLSIKDAKRLGIPEEDEFSESLSLSRSSSLRFDEESSDFFKGKGADDPEVLRELQLYMENEYSLDNQYRSIIKNIQGKLKSGKYDAKLAPKLWMYWIQSGIKAYKKEHGAEDLSELSKKDKQILANYFAEEGLEHAEEGLSESLSLSRSSSLRFDESSEKRAMIEDIRQFKTDRVSMLEDIKDFKAERKAMLTDIAILKKERKWSIEELKRLKEEVGEEWEEPEDGEPIEDALEEADFGLDDDDEFPVEDFEEESDMEDEEDWGPEEFEEEGDDEEEEPTPYSFEEEEVDPYVVDEDESFEDESVIEEEFDDEDETFVEEEDFDDEDEILEEYDFGSEDEEEFVESGYDVDPDEDDVEEYIESLNKKLSSKKKLEAAKRQRKGRAEVKRFYEAAVKKHSSIKDIRSKVLACKTVKEAYKVVSDYTTKAVEKPVRVKESAKATKGKMQESRSGWLPKGAY